MKEMFLLIKELLAKNEPLVLATVIRSSGSTPRGAGARMLVGKGSGGSARLLWGTIGGGLPEHTAIEEAGRLLQKEKAARSNLKTSYAPFVSFKNYVLRPGEAADLGARCGGDVSIFFRTLNAAEPGLPEFIEKGISCFNDQKPAWFIMEAACKEEFTNTDFSMGLFNEDGCLAYLGAMPINYLCFLKPAPVFREEGESCWFSEPLISGGFAYIFGGGHIARELVPLLAHLDFRCIVFDDREEFSRPELFPGADKVILGDFNNIGKSITLSNRDFAVIITRGHLWDLEAWAFALNSPASYIGVIGSKSKHEFVRGQLRERGFAESTINASRVHAPIGIKIKSDTPAEIAVSIAGELVLCRAQMRY